MTAMFLLLAALPLVAPGAQAATVFAEDWNSFPGSWSVSGGGNAQDCTTGNPGCSLLMNPACCSTYETVSRSVSIGFSSDLTVTTDFLSSCTCGDTDAAFKVGFSNGEEVYFHFSGGANNGVILQVNHGGGGSNSQSFGSWGSANTWFRAVLLFDQSSNSVQAELRDNLGNVMATSSAITLSVGSSTVSQLLYYAVFWGNVQTSFHHDTLRVSTLDPVAPSAPLGLAASPGPGLGQITLNWAAPISDGGSAITGYKVYRSETSGGPYGLIAPLGNVLSYTDSGRDVGKIFFYVVSAVNAVGEGPGSNEASAPGTGIPETIPFGVPPVSQQFVVPAQTVTTPEVTLPATCTLTVCTSPTIIPAQTLTTPPVAPQTVTVPGVDPQTVTTPDVTVPQTCIPLVICVGPVTIPSQTFGPTPEVPSQSITTPGVPSQSVTVPGQTVPPICSVVPSACFGPTTIVGPTSATTPLVSVSVTTTALAGSVSPNLGESTPIGPIHQDVTVGGITIPVTLCPNTCPVPVAPGASFAGTLAVAVTVGTTSQGVTVPINV